jgi:hypothetical protein
MIAAGAVIAIIENWDTHEIYLFGTTENQFFPYLHPSYRWKYSLESTRMTISFGNLITMAIIVCDGREWSDNCESRRI